MICRPTGRPDAVKPQGIEIAGQPVRKLNNTLRSLASLPVEVTPL